MCGLGKTLVPDVPSLFSSPHSLPHCLSRSQSCSQGQVCHWGLLKGPNSFKSVIFSLESNKNKIHFELWLGSEDASDCIMLGQGCLRALLENNLFQGGPGSVRFGYGLEMERFKRFRFSVPAVPLQKGIFCISAQFNRKGRFRFRFRFLENGSGGSGSAFGSGKNGSDGSGFRFRLGS